MTFFVRSPRVLGSVAVLALFLCVTAPQTSSAQVWSRTTRVVAPIQPNGPIRAFLDTLVQVEGQTEGIRVRQAPNQKRMEMARLRNTLQTAYGLDVVSADHVLVGYQFSIADGEGFTQTITDLHFLYRGTHETEDVSLLSLDTAEKWVQSVLRNKGVPLKTNRDSFLSFWQQFSFIVLTQLDETDVVEIGGKTVHEGFGVKRRALIQQIRHLAYSDVYNSFD